MTARRPLVLINGIQYQLPPGDTLNAVALSLGVDLVNESAQNLPKCTPVCPGSGAGAGGFQPARANAIGTSRVFGLIAADQIGPGAAGAVMNFGLLSATSAQWNAVTGQRNGLTPGAIYYLADLTTSRLTTNPPTNTGRFLVKVGQALTQTIMFIAIDPPIGL